ncbi:hypothetical protein Q4601_06605 [Shewanella sp. 1_MG-2023]|jgi:hypothetical protein|uniref:Cardiolipin synthase N-terminal domain-containing protein n=1 Tax=Shewanella electrodiphila TaxID=934143 RepID=A0ABT0KNZ0_9GAMM|nr:MULTISPECIES: hypothetical protein [Shewanella]MCC4831413.1 hypothetical protein [Shewanella sp. 10N.7]MCL1045251.1 hypothetical protein [Shewanella electrodiphila]MDO6611893.1 hypothetical protein [Shewanella sp. 7_MG-2023]MDO6771748.1 hypothetical protein [Shewanella sp. 2_MG-2023]MDO6793974.1 hypothetical protein [Shewanella sp. 1_MG-2023]
MEQMDLVMLLILLLSILHIMFCHRAITTGAHIDNVRRYLWGTISLIFGPLGYYIYQNLLPLDSLDPSE